MTTRSITVAAGRLARSSAEPRAVAVDRMLRLMDARITAAWSWWYFPSWR